MISYRLIISEPPVWYGLSSDKSLTQPSKPPQESSPQLLRRHGPADGDWMGRQQDLRSYPAGGELDGGKRPVQYQLVVIYPHNEKRPPSASNTFRGRLRQGSRAHNKPMLPTLVGFCQRPGPPPIRCGGPMALRRQPRTLVLTAKGGMPANQDPNPEAMEHLGKAFRFLLMTTLLRYEQRHRP